MRLTPLMILAAIAVILPTQGENKLSDAQTNTLLERYEEGIQSGKFEYRLGKTPEDLEQYLRNGNLLGIRQEILLGVEQSLPDPESRIEEEFGNSDPEGNPWGSDGGWDEETDATSTEVTGWIQGVAEAALACNYAEAKRLADLVLKHDPTNDWINANYSEIEVWAERAVLYYNALNAAYAALEIDDLGNLVIQLREALENAASNCDQDKVARTLLNQAMEASRNDRFDAIAQAKREGAIHQQSFAQTLTTAATSELAKAEQSKNGMRRGLMGLLNTAVKVGTLKKGGNISSEDAIVQVLQEQAAQANPEVAQLIAQSQQLQQQAAQTNPDLSQTLDQLQQQLNEPKITQTGIGAGQTPTLSPTTNRDIALSPICQQIIDRLNVLGEEVSVLSTTYASYQGNANVSMAQIQNTATQMTMKREKISALLKQLKANDCPGSESIPDYPGF